MNRAAVNLGVSHARLDRAVTAVSRLSAVLARISHLAGSRRVRPVHSTIIVREDQLSRYAPAAHTERRRVSRPRRPALTVRRAMDAAVELQIIAVPAAIRRPRVS